MDDGRELADRLGDKVEFLKTDVSLETDVKRMIDYAVDRFGKLDCLFNNAGVPATHGSIATGIFGKAAGLPTDQAEKTAEVMKQALVDFQPIRRAGIVDDIARAAVFLASDESTFINGHDLVVDGGLTGGRLWSVQQEGLKAMRQALSDASKS